MWRDSLGECDLLFFFLICFFTFYVDLHMTCAYGCTTFSVRCLLLICIYIFLVQKMKKEEEEEDNLMNASRIQIVAGTYMMIR